MNYRNHFTKKQCKKNAYKTKTLYYGKGPYTNRDSLELFLECHFSPISFINTVFPLISAGPQISAASLGIHIEISASPLISAAPSNATLIRTVTIFY